MQRRLIYHSLLFFLILCLSLLTIPKSLAQENFKAGLPEGTIARLGKGGINIMRFSPDGTYLAVSTDFGLWLHDVATGEEKPFFLEQHTPVNTLAFSSDGKYLASGTYREPIHIWNLKTKTIHTTLTLPGERNALNTLAFKANTLISINNSRYITIWDLDKSEPISESRLPAPYTKFAFSKDGKYLAAKYRGGSTILWNTETESKMGTLKRDIKDGNTSIVAMAFSPDGKVLASGGEDNRVDLWDTHTQKKLASLVEHTGWVTALAFSADGNILASGDANKTIKLWDVNTHKMLTTIKGHRNTITSLAFSPNGTPKYVRVLASTSIDGTIRFWNSISGEEIEEFESGYTESVKAVAFSEDDSSIAVAAFNGVVDVWSLKTQREIATLYQGHCDQLSGVAFSSNGKYFARQGYKGLVWFSPISNNLRANFNGQTNFQLWNIHSGKEIIGPWNDISPDSPKTVFLPDNDILIVNSDEVMQSWDIETGNELFNLGVKQTSHSTGLVASSDGKWIATIGSNGKPHVWEIASPEVHPMISSKEAGTLAFSPDSRFLAMDTRDGIYLWNFTHKLEEELTLFPDELEEGANVMTFSPDGSVLFSSMWDIREHHITLWDVNNTTKMGVLLGHIDRIETLVFSHDGQTLASGSQDGTVLLWDWDKISKTE